MKYLCALLLLVFCQSAYCCTNLSGSFETAEKAVYEIIQNDCDSMDLVDAQRVFKILFNGTEQLIYDFDLVNGDEIIGRQKVYITSRIENEKWIYDEKAISLYADGTQDLKVSWSEVFLNKDSNLVTIVHRSNGAIETYIDQRITHQKI